MINTTFTIDFKFCNPKNAYKSFLIGTGLLSLKKSDKHRLMTKVLDIIRYLLMLML